MAESQPPRPASPGFARRVLPHLSPSREHTATSAAFLLVIATTVARLVGYLREAYVAYAFGAGPITDAYVAAFTLRHFLDDTEFPLNTRPLEFDSSLFLVVKTQWWPSSPRSQ